MRRIVAIGTLCVALAVGSLFVGPSVAAKPRARMRTLQVYAAASLSDAFRDIARTYERQHPGARVELNLAGSQQLAAQIEQGAAADVFASADDRWMDYVKQLGLVSGDAVVFVRNRLVVVVPRTNPARIRRLQDLARPGVKLVLGAEAVPVGHYSREVLQNLSRSEGFDGLFGRRAMANLVSEEENVKAVVSKVQLGEADAGFCYRSDVTPSVSRYVRIFTIPDSVNALASYPIAILAHSSQRVMAQEFIDLVRSPVGQRILEVNEFIPASAPSP